MRKIGWSFLILFAGMLTYTNEARSAPPEFILGVGVHSGQGRASLNQVKPLMQWAGIQSVRQEVYWHRLELKKGELKFPENLVEVERFVDYTISKGGEPLLILNYGNKFYDEGDGVSSPEAVDAFAKYAEFVARYFNGRVKLYEVWNEWNIGMGSNKSPRTVRDVSRYVSLLAATYKIVKAVDSGNVVVGGAVAGIDTKWINSFVEAGGMKHLDAFSVHPYLMWNITSKPEHSISWIDKIHQMLEKKAGKSVPIYITEIGWPNHDARISWSEDQTADFLIRFHILARARSYIKGVWWYELVNSGRGRDNKEKTFGLVDADLKAKPALRAYQLISKIFNELVEIESSPSDERFGVVRWKAKMKDGSICQGHWRVAVASGARIAAPIYKAELKTLWGDASTLDETPYIGCGIARPISS